MIVVEGLLVGSVETCFLLGSYSICGGTSTDDPPRDFIGWLVVFLLAFAFIISSL